MTINITTNVTGTWNVVNSSSSLNAGTYKAYNLSWINTLNTTYYLWVNLTDGYDWNNESYTITTHGEYIPDPPNSFSATAASSSQINLAWANGNRANKTYIRYKQGATAPVNRTDGTLLYNSSGTSTSATGLSASTTYSFKAWSYNDTGSCYSIFNVTSSATTSSSGGGNPSSGSSPPSDSDDDEEDADGEEDTDDEEPPEDTDNDGIPDDPTEDYPEGDPDDDNDGVDDEIEEILGSDPKTDDAADITDLLSDSYLVDSDGDGKFDKYYDLGNNINSSVSQINDNEYYIDSDDDGKWDYIYNHAQGTLTAIAEEQEEKPSEDEPFITVGIIGIVIAIIILIFIFLFRKHILFFEKKKKDEDEKGK